ncbi:MAG: heparinase II/III family protein [Bacteroidales bacterium]
MTKLMLSGLLILLISLPGFAFTERNSLQKVVTAEKLNHTLIRNQEWVPFPTYDDRAGWAELMGKYQTDYIKKGERSLNYNWKTIKASDYLEYTRSGNRNIMQDPYNANRNALLALTMAELAEGKGRFMDQIVNGVFFMCEQTSWVLSAHLSAQEIKGSLPDYREQVIDLGSGEAGAMLSWIYFFFNKEFDKVHPIIAPRLRHELQERILDAYMNTDKYWWLGFNYKPGTIINNWNPWCNFNVLQSFLLLENDPVKLNQAIEKTVRSVDQFMNYNHADGGCEEGPSYWDHAAGKLYDYLKLLNMATGNQLGLFNDPLVKHMGEYIAHSYVGNDWVINFADASAKGGGGADLIFRYGKAVESTLMMNHAAYLRDVRKASVIGGGAQLFRIFESLQFAEELNNYTYTPTVAPDKWYPETQFCYIRNKKFVLASKGGNNNESHNHNDVGTFSLYYNQTPMFIDAGVGTYTRQTFGKERYSIWCMQSNYHNLPLINGYAQVNGAEYQARETEYNKKKKSFRLDIAKAYPADAGINHYYRKYTLQNNGLIIEDSFDLQNPTTENQVNFLVWGKPDITQQGAIGIFSENEKLVLHYDKSLFTVSTEAIPQPDTRLSKVWGKEIYRITLTAKRISTKGNYIFTINEK